jgi:uncharacterized RDD family membrane protein YckC
VHTNSRSLAEARDDTDSLRPRASIARRFAALLYEALLLVALVFIGSFLLTPLVSPGSASSGSLMLPSTAGRIISFVSLFTLGAAFFGWSWSEGRRTLPMKTWRLALVTTEGAPLSRRTALVRYIAVWIGPALAVVAYALVAPTGFGALAWPLIAINWLAAIVDPERQFLHDCIAGTRIVAITA